MHRNRGRILANRSCTEQPQSSGAINAINCQVVGKSVSNVRKLAFRMKADGNRHIIGWHVTHGDECAGVRINRKHRNGVGVLVDGVKKVSRWPYEEGPR